MKVKVMYRGGDGNTSRMEGSCPRSIILCVLLIAGTWSIKETSFIKLPCLYERPYHHPLNDQPASPRPAWVLLGGGQDIHGENLDFEGVKFLFKDSPVNLMPFLKDGLEDVKCDIAPYFTANTQILWPGVINPDNAVDSWYIYRVQHNGGKFHTATFFTKLPETPEKDEEDRHLVLATFMISTKTPNIYATLADSALLDCAFAVDHRAEVLVTWSYLGRGSLEVKLLSYNGVTKKLEHKRKDVYMQEEELQNGRASLIVNNLALTSEGLYTCSVSVASLFAEQQIRLQIRESPTVSLNVDSILTLTEGDEIKFACDASNYYPLDVTIEWLRELPNTALLPSVMSNVIYSSHRINRNGTYSLTGFFLLKVSLPDNGVKFTCRVEHESLKKPIRKSVTLIVSESPPWFLMVFITFLILALLYFVRMFCKARNASKAKPY
ncbi:tapasin-related protein-like isoform 2-T3 [Anomaloglossus baeobatrachus]|uniref:tapasin-related protein-like n=1 Tax=Anomaloglossus baeobatrachus TaxID=238106 RepID=UPI003F4F7BB6